MATESDYQIHVSAAAGPSGDGSSTAPLSSLIAAGLDRPVRVLFQGGYYRLDETLILGPEDSGSDEYPVTWCAATGEEVLVGAGVPISRWQRLQDEPPNLAKAAQGKLWVADLPADTPFITTLYRGLERLPRASSNNFNPTRQPDEDPEKLHPQSNAGNLRQDVVYLPPELLGEWSTLSDVELVVRPCYGWVCNILTFAEVDRQSGRAVTTIPATYPMKTEITHLEETDDQPCWLENYLEVLDRPGNWVYSSTERRLYYWPPEGEPGDDIVYPALAELIRIEGDDEAQRFPRHLTLEGFTFVHGARETLAADDAGLQHDWDMWDKGNALVRLRNTERVAVRNCRFTASSGGGLRLDRFAQHDRIDGNTLEHLGGTGILLCGYGPGTTDVHKNNEVTNNTIHRCGEIYWHSLGIMVWQSGANHIAHNLVHHMPYTGMAVLGVRTGHFAMGGDKRENTRTLRRDEIGDFGDDPGAVPWEKTLPFLHARDNVVECNELHHTCEVMEDGNAIYLSGCGTDNEVRFNYVHHVVSRDHHGALRTDDLCRDSRWHHNVVHSCTYANFVLKHHNAVEDNLFIDPSAPLIGLLVVRLDPCDYSSVRRNIFISSGEEELPFVRLEKARGLKQVDANVYWSEVNREWADRALQEMKDGGFEDNGRVLEVRFRDPDKRDFRVVEDSPLVQMGIEGADLRQVGPQGKFSR